MKLRVFIFFCLTIAVAGIVPASAQADSAVSQFTSSPRESFAGSISGDGRFVVFESTGDLATINPRNADGNSEIFLWDFAQRRIYQITDTKPVQRNTFGDFSPANIKVDIVNKRPVISQNGRWISFASNATSATVALPDSTNPGSFNGNDLNTQAAPPCTLPTPTPSPSPTATVSPTPTPSPTASPTASPSPTSTPFNNPLQCDANLEVWLYEIPASGPADLSSGEDYPVTNLSGGAFTLISNSVPSRLPLEGTATRQPFVADDNHDASIDDDGNVVAFVSTRDLVPNGNSQTGEGFNDEIFTYVHGGVSSGAMMEPLAVEATPTRKRKAQRETTESFSSVSASASVPTRYHCESDLQQKPGDFRRRTSGGFRKHRR